MEPTEDRTREQQLLRHARREGLLIMLVWLIALLWSTAVCYGYGYHRPAAEITLILGIPDWVFWGIVLPWVLCLVFSGWFCFFFMADDDLGRDPDEGPGHG